MIFQPLDTIKNESPSFQPEWLNVERMFERVKCREK